MNAAAIVTIIAIVLVVLVIVGFLLAIARVLVGVDKSIKVVIEAVGAITAKTEPVAYVVDSLNSNLDKASGTLTSLLESKVGAAGAAQLVASVDPLSPIGPTPSERQRIHYGRQSPAVAVAEPAAAVAEPAAHENGTSHPEPAGSPGAQPVTETTERPFPGAGGEIRFGGRPNG